MADVTTSLWSAIGMDHGDGPPNFAGEFLALARRKPTGTYRVTCTEGRERSILFRDGLVIDVDTGEELSILAASILTVGAVSEKDLKRARKAQTKANQSLGAILLSQTELDEEKLLTALRTRITDEVCALFTTEIREALFIDHAADERIEGFSGELSDVLDVYTDPEELYLEAAHRTGRWDLVEQGFNMLRDVYYATPGAFKYFREETLYRQEVTVIGFVDGRRDVSEVIDASLELLGKPAGAAVQAADGTSQPADRFRTFSIVRALVAQGELELINPVQMFQLGVEFQQEGQHGKALKLFLRASERGLDDFDLGWKTAQATEALGRPEEAASRYKEFGDKCIAQFRTDEAIRSYRKACELEPGNLVRQVKLLKILIQENRRDEIISHAILLAGRFAMNSKAKEGLELLLDLRRTGFKDGRLGEKIIDLAEQCGDQETLRAERERMATDFCARKDIEKALDMYQQMFCDGNCSVEVRLKLIDLHLERGDRKIALQHIRALLSLGEGEKIRDETVLQRLHGQVCELNPGDSRSNRWLVDYHLRVGNRTAAVEVLQGLVSHLEKEGEFRQAILVLRQLTLLDPDGLDHIWRLAAALLKLGKIQEHIQELRKAAQLALHKNQSPQAERALGEILKTSPLDVEARKSLADLAAARGDSKKAVALFKEVALLDLLSGNLHEAQDYCRRLLVIEPKDPEIVYKLGDMCRTAGDDQKAVEQFVKAARLHLDGRNLGAAREAISFALQIRPANAECMDLKRALEEMEARLNGSPPEPKTVAPAPAPVVVPVTPPGFPAGDSVYRPGRGPEEPFQPSAPITRKGLGGITARLRNIKAGGGAAEKGAEGASPAGGEAQPGPAGEAGSDSTGTAPAIRSKGTGIANAASRLKALAGKGGDAPAPGAVPSSGTASGPEGSSTRPAPATRSKGAGIANAASRLRALSGKNEDPQVTEANPTDSKSPTSNADAEELERLQTAIQGGGPVTQGAPGPSEAQAPVPAAPGVPSMGGKTFGKSAALLAQLRKNLQAQVQLDEPLGKAAANVAAKETA